MSAQEKQYYTCKIGNFDGNLAILEECIHENKYILHDHARFPSALRDIQQGNTVLLIYNSTIVAWGEVSDGYRNLNNGEWTHQIQVEQWNTYSDQEVTHGVSSYGISGATEKGYSMAVVRRMNPEWAKKKINNWKQDDEIKLFHQISLENVANWQINPNNTTPTVFIPRLQRGLVWNPRRMEVLWDSLMRGIPVGTFLFAPAEGCDDQIKAESEIKTANLSNCFLLMDGQQRSNCIAMGFREYPPAEKNEKLPILWLDLKAPEAKGTQKFYPKVTTLAHPWGYKNGAKETHDSIFRHQERRAAIDKCKWSSIDKKRPAPKDLWPCDATLPIPMYFLLKANCNNEKLFWEEVLNRIKTVHNEWSKEVGIKICEFINAQKRASSRRAIYQGVKQAKATKIFAQCAPLEAESDSEGKENESNMSTLFERINTQGITPSREELDYSALKALCPKLSKIDEIADKQMFAPRMAALAVRVFFCYQERKWTNSVSLSKVKSKLTKVAQNNQNGFENFIAEEFPQLVNRVDVWFGLPRTEECVSNKWKILPYHQMSISQKSPEIYQLLLLIALCDKSKQLDLLGSRIAGLASCLHLFSLDKKTVAECIFKQLFVDRGELDLWQSIQRGISKALSTEVKMKRKYRSALLTPFAPETLPISLMEWRSFKSSYMDRASFNQVSNGYSGKGNEILLYALREHMRNEFPGYDPAQKDMWESYNRPWDNDHILPKSWVDGKRKVNANVRELLNSMGNIAPLSFSSNRTKGAKEAGAEYGKGLTLPFLSLGDIASYRKDMVKMDDAGVECFVNATLTRAQKLYKKWYDDLEIKEICGGVVETNPEVQSRKQLIESIGSNKIFSNAKIHYVENEREYELMDNDALWCKKWVSVGSIINEDYYLCICSDGETIQVGLRKLPTESELNKSVMEKIEKIKPEGYSLNVHGWWYLYKKLENAGEAEIVKELENLKVIQI